jgi:hypothetical protein
MFGFKRSSSRCPEVVYTVVAVEYRRRHLLGRVENQFGARDSQDDLSDCVGAEYVLYEYTWVLERWIISR